MKVDPVSLVIAITMISESNSRNSGRVLAIMTTWPSREHPYLIRLLGELKLRIPALQLLLFKKSDDLEFADEILGGDIRRLVLDKAIYRFEADRSPINVVRALVAFLKHPMDTRRAFLECRNQGYSIKTSVGQLLLNYELIGKKFSLIYINALQAGRHFCLPAFFQDTPIIASSRGQDFDWDPHGYDRILESIDHLHVLGEYLRERAISRGFPADKITQIPPAVVTLPQGLHKSSKRGRSFTVATAARLVWIKGYAYSLRAVAELKARLPSDVKLRYIIMGDGPEMEFLKAECHRLGIVESVVFTGWLSENEVVGRLMDADVYLLLSIGEGFNNSAMLAQSLGVPCVVSDAGGLPENVLDGQTGFVVPRYSVGLASERLTMLYSDLLLRRRLGENAKLRMVEEFSLQRQVECYYRLFTSHINIT